MARHHQEQHDHDASQVPLGACAALLRTPPRGALKGKWRVFAHFQNAHGRMLFQGDHMPTRPFAWWQDGQYIRYTKTVSVPHHVPTEDVTLRLGIYQRATRLPIRATRVRVHQNRAAVGTLKVLR